ncbi:MAG: adenosine deaminase [Anaerolineaceae bacterium]|nr:adenosine deaminase [Anaerolineaceae bacterium]MBN2677472.1 adenosine deaminase [Anaerolineaceae bacterium]
MIDTALPLVDLHRHLEGSIRLETVLELSEKHELPIPAGGLEGLQEAVWMSEPTSDILKIMPKFDLLRQVYVDYEVCKQVARECIQDAIDEGLDYVELRFSPFFMAEMHQLDPMGVTEAVCDAWQQIDKEFPLRSRLVGILSRTYGPEICLQELIPVMAFAGKGLVGLDLAGDEARWPAGLFKEHFERARNAGLRLTAHAGEFAGADSVRETIEILKPDRIGHAVHAADDPAVMALIADRGITIESCPTSNYFTCSVPSYEAHPLPVFLKNGLKVTLNADDPTLFSGLSVWQEYELAAEMMGVSQEESKKMQLDGLEAAFISAEQKADIQKRKQIDF